MKTEKISTLIDNFSIVRSHLEFKSDFDRYIIHIIKRAKDDEGKMYGTNETNRLLKTFYITSLEYFDRKIPVIKDLCDSNKARAYILPQVRDNSACLKELLKIVVDNLDNPTIKPDHLIRSAFCGYHGSRNKKWVLDLDDDNMIEYVDAKKKVWTTNKIMKLVQNSLISIGKKSEDAYLLDTPHGHCIVTSTFDLQKAYKKCNMLFQGLQKMQTDYKVIGPDETKPIYKNINGWLIKDGMALLYYRNN